ncbi:MAG: 4-hydroxy-tetrahydrodipicolinate synthase [Candidatus Bipolaricaulia bacterium]
MRLHGGVIVPLITPYQPDGAVDVTAFGEHIGFLLEYVIDGVFVMGTTGETPLLTQNERETLIHKTVQTVRGKVTVFSGVGAPSTQETIRWCQLTAEAGADINVVITPYFFKLSQPALLNHLTQVADASPLPVVIYHYPAVTGNTLDPETVARLARHENIVGLKDSSGDLKRFYLYLQATESKNFSRFQADDGLILPAMMIGGDGVVSGLANAFPELIVDLVAAIRNEDLRRARETQGLILTIQKIMLGSSPIAGIKACLELKGKNYARWLRAPLEPMPAESKHASEHLLREKGLLA